MARMDDLSSDYRRWTTAKLIREIRSKANLERFGGYLPEGYNCRGFPYDDGDAIREATRIYRESWLNPLIDELERRTIKPAKVKP